MELMELLTYGFRRVVEELQVTQGVIQMTSDNTKNTETQLKVIDQKLDQIENHLLILNEQTAACAGYLDKIGSCEHITQMNIIRILKGMEALEHDGEEITSVSQTE